MSYLYVIKNDKGEYWDNWNQVFTANIYEECLQHRKCVSERMIQLNNLSARIVKVKIVEVEE